MLFSSAIFLYKFLPVTILIYFLLPKNFRNMFLLLASLIFYAWGEPVYILLMITSISLNYMLGIMIEQSVGKRSTWYLRTGLGINIALLVYYKYFWFICQNVNYSFGWNVGTSVPIALPIGISFYTFHAISYLMDVYRREVKAQRNFLDAGLYITFFPQLIAGPIIRYKDIHKQIESRTITLEGFSYGIERFILGLAKKVLLANALGEVADKIFTLPQNTITTSAAWFGILCYSFQIFFDFSGYSDMAIGLARMFGFTFRENFNYPYAAKGIRDFWRRWHISLSTWFRDYLYIPLGGNKGSNRRTYFNLIFVFFITGLWHGASWNFVIWGLFHGFFLILERKRPGKILDSAWTPVQHIYTLLVVVIAWVFFRIESFGEAINYLKVMAGLGEYNEYTRDVTDFINLKVMLCFIVSAVVSVPLLGSDWIAKTNGLQNVLKACAIIFLIGLFMISAADIASDTYNPFIYFRF